MPVPKSVTTQLSPLRTATILTCPTGVPFTLPFNHAEAAVQSPFMLKLEKLIDIPEAELERAYEIIALLQLAIGVLRACGATNACFWAVQELITVPAQKLALSVAPTQSATERALSSLALSLIHISEPTRLGMISYAVFC